MLDEILANKRIELEETMRQTPLAILRERVSRRQSRRFSSALRGDGIRLIAEVKKASPSRGLLCPDFDPVRLALEYERGGASTISVLTESRYFMGSLEHLAGIREAVQLPLLRKDFIIDPYQVYEAGAYGADAILLIVAALDQASLGGLMDTARTCGLECLVEVHSASEISTALDCGAQIIGINNRDLKTLKVDIGTAGRLRRLVPHDCIAVAESGVRGRSEVDMLAALGFNAALIGEALVTANDIPACIKELGFVRIKVCGIRTEEDARAATLAGIDFVGVVLAPSRRRVTPAQARRIAAAVRSCHTPTRTVGVFVDTPVGEVNSTAAECGLDYVQLSGNESMDYCREVKYPVIKALHIGMSLPQFGKKAGLVYLLDTHVEGKYGGTGITFDWKLAQQASRQVPIILAGGLTPVNVAEAIRLVGSWGVDVSSGVETDGVKDMDKVRVFVEAIRREDASEA